MAPPKLLGLVLEDQLINRKATYVNDNRNNSGNFMGAGLFCCAYRRRTDPHTAGGRTRCIRLQHDRWQTSRLAERHSKGRHQLLNASA